MKKNTVEYVRKCRGGMKDCEHSMGQLQNVLLHSFNEGTLSLYKSYIIGGNLTRINASVVDPMNK